jgi:hypothetical protein
MLDARPGKEARERGRRPSSHDLAGLNCAGWLLVLSTAVILLGGLLAVGYLMHTPKSISMAQWAACAGVFFLSLAWFRLSEAAMRRCGIPIYREQSGCAGVGNGDGLG